MNPSTALATVLVDELVRCGVRHAVLCPGSRSAPLAYALQQADREGRLTLHVRVDERSAAFLALGLGKLSRVPAVVVTTSGTAVANLHPAVLEAHHAVVPLVVLSADRPEELRGTGANQTTVQPGMFGGATRWSDDLDAPVRRVGEVARWRTAARAAVRHAIGGPGEPGPVHLNVQLREPLVPTEAEGWPEELSSGQDPADRAAMDALAGRTGSAGDEPRSRSAVGRPESNAVDDVAGEPRTVVVVGDLPEPLRFAEVLAWASSHGWPVVAEPFGTYPRPGVVAHGPLVLSVAPWLDGHAPLRVVTVGRVTLSRPVAALLRRPGVRLEAVRTHRWIESRPDVARVWEPDVLQVWGALGSRRAMTGTTGSTGEVATFADQWEAAGQAVDQALSQRLGGPSGGSSSTGCGLGGVEVAEVLWREVPAGATLFVGSSNSCRDLDVTARPRTAPLTVVASRGLAGIDGCVSTAAGIALSGDGPTYAWMGDLTFLHDANGLLIGPQEPRPDLTIVVTNDDGGGIFTLLEPGEPERAGDFERVFATPTGADLAAVCAAHGAGHQRVTTVEGLRQAVARAPRGLRVVEVPVDRAGHRASHAHLRELARTALG